MTNTLSNQSLNTLAKEDPFPVPVVIGRALFLVFHSVFLFLVSAAIRQCMVMLVLV